MLRNIDPLDLTLLPDGAMPGRHFPVSKYSLMALLCCFVPLAALAATLYLHTPSALTVLVALILLIPLARWLLRSAWEEKP
jgi:hypothetical protein